MNELAALEAVSEGWSISPGPRAAASLMPAIKACRSRVIPLRVTFQMNVLANALRVREAVVRASDNAQQRAAFLLSARIAYRAFLDQGAVWQSQFLDFTKDETIPFSEWKHALKPIDFDAAPTGPVSDRDPELKRLITTHDALAERLQDLVDDKARRETFNEMQKFASEIDEMRSHAVEARGLGLVIAQADRVATTTEHVFRELEAISSLLIGVENLLQRGEYENVAIDKHLKDVIRRLRGKSP